MTHINTIEYTNINIATLENEKQEPGIIVLVTDQQVDYSFWESVSDIGFDVYLFETEDEIEQLLESRTIEIIYIREENKIQHLSFITRLIKFNQISSVVYYNSLQEILLSKTKSTNEFTIIQDTFKLINTLFDEEKVQVVEHLNSVANYVELICDRLQISQERKFRAIAAAYMHAFSMLIMESAATCENEKDIIRLSSQCLKTINYTPEVCTLLDLMYTNIDDVLTQTRDFELANIVTAADYYCHSNFCSHKITAEQFKELHQTIQSNIGTLFLPQVGKELFNSLYDSIEIIQETAHTCHVAIYSKLGKDQLMLVSCLGNLGFDAELVSSVDKLRDMYNKNKIDILVIEAKGTVLEVSDLVNKIEDNDICFDKVITYILTNRESVFELTGLLQKGIEDIFNSEIDLDPFLIKIIRAKKRLLERSQQQIDVLEKMGTYGNLADMNLIDLLQTMNGSGKTCLLNITANSKQLSIYVHDGKIMYAENDDCKGKEAIFAGLQWERGIWNIDPMAIEEFPNPNIDQPINNILLEGCQILDESQKIETCNKTESDIDAEIENSFNFLD